MHLWIVLSARRVIILKWSHEIFPFFFPHQVYLTDWPDWTDFHLPKIGEDTFISGKCKKN